MVLGPSSNGSTSFVTQLFNFTFKEVLDLECTSEEEHVVKCFWMTTLIVGRNIQSKFQLPIFKVTMLFIEEPRLHRDCKILQMPVLIQWLESTIVILT